MFDAAARVDKVLEPVHPLMGEQLRMGVSSAQTRPGKLSKRHAGTS
jgi:hypothetical protein